MPVRQRSAFCRLSGYALALALTAAMTACSGGGGGGPVTPPPPPGSLVLSVSPSAASLSAGTTLQLTATAVHGDGSHEDVTASAAWTSSDPAIVGVAAGLASGGSPGTATVTASYAGKASTATLTVTAVPIPDLVLSVSPAAASLAAGTSLQLTATAVHGDGSHEDVTASATWTSSDPAIVGVAAGLATGASAGTATVTASLTGVSATATLTVTSATLQALAIDPDAVETAMGVDMQLKALGLYSDGSRQDITGQVTWSSADGTVASVSAGGLLHPLASGATTVRAELGALSALAPVTVTSATLDAVDVWPPAASLPLGTQLPLQATGSYSDGTTIDLTGTAAWTSSGPAVTVSAGVVTAAQVGAATVTATFGGVSGTADLQVTDATLTSLTVSPATLTLPRGSVAPLTATATYSDGTQLDVTTQVGWISSDETVAAVSGAAGSEGAVTARAKGSAAITATLGGMQASVAVTVTDAVLQTVTVTPSTASVPVGLSRPFRATATYSDASTVDVTSLATWTSSNTSVATVSTVGASAGQATGLVSGTATLRANFQGVVGTATLTVTTARLVGITVTPATSQLAVRGTQQLTATASLSDGSTLDVTGQCNWQSSNRKVAAVSKKGLVRGLTSGTVTITAKRMGKRGTATVSVQ